METKLAPIKKSCFPCKVLKLKMDGSASVNVLE